MLSRAINTHAELERPQDREWIHTLLSFLRTYANDTSKELISEEGDEKYVTHLINALHTAALSLDSGACLLNAAIVC